MFDVYFFFLYKKVKQREPWEVKAIWTVIFMLAKLFWNFNFLLNWPKRVFFFLISVKYICLCKRPFISVVLYKIGLRYSLVEWSLLLKKNYVLFMHRVAISFKYSFLYIVWLWYDSCLIRFKHFQCYAALIK